MCLHYICVEVPTTCAHSSDGSCKVHVRLQHVEVRVVRIVPRIITGTFVTRWTTCRGDRFTTHEGVFIVAGGRVTG